MALDPRVLAALSSGAKASGTFDPSKISSSSSGGDGGFSLGQSVIDILSTGGYATAGMTSKLGQNVAAIGKGELGAVADLLNPFSLAAAGAKGVAERRTYSQNLRDMGVEGNSAVWLGLALDIGLDPTTYITGGLLAGVKGATQGAKIASQATKAGKIAVKPVQSVLPTTRLAGAVKKTEAFAPINRPLTESEKLGNLLSGIGTGYAKGKANYKVSVAGNKLERLSRKADKKAKKIAAVTPDAIAISPSIAAKIKKTQDKLSDAKDAADKIEFPVSAGQSKVRPPGAETGSSAVAAEISEELATGSKINDRLNKLAQTLVRPGAVAADVAKFDETKAAFLDKAFDFSSQELATLRGSNAGFNEVSLASVQKFLDAPKVVQDANKAKATIEAILAAPARIGDDAIELQEELAKAGADLRTATVDDLLFVASEATDPLVKRQAAEAFELSKVGLDEAALAAPAANRPWIEGIHTAQDAGDAARSIVDWIAPQLREGAPAAFKTIAKAIEDALQPKLAKAAGGAEKPLTPEAVEEVVGRFLDDGLAAAVSKIEGVDPAIANTYNDIAELSADLQAGKLELSAADKRNLSVIMGVPEDNVASALQKIVNDFDGVEQLLDPAAEATDIGKGIITGPDAVTATGNAAGADAANAAEDVIDSAGFADDVMTESVSPEAQAALLRMREAAAEDFVRELSSTGEIFDSKERLRIVEIIRDSILPKITKQLQTFAKAQDKSVEQVLREALEGDIRAITEDPQAFTIGGALKLDELGSHGRIDVFDRLIRGQAKFYKSAPADKVLGRELRTASAVESLMRSLGIPVRSTESTMQALRRKGIKPNTKAARKVRPEYSSVTWTDIGRAMVNSGKLDLAYELRRVRGEANEGYQLGNFLPTAIESAWLAVKRLNVAGEGFAKGSKNREEIIDALDNVSMRGGEFEKAPHVVAADKLGGAQAAAIAKTKDDLIDFLADNYDALKAIDDQREALIVAAQAERVRPLAVGVFAQMTKFASEFQGLKSAFKDGGLSEEIMTLATGNLLKSYDDFLSEISTGGFSDPAIAAKIASVYKSIFLNASIKGPDGNTLSLAPLLKELDETLSMTRAMDAAGTPAAAKNARRAQKVKAYDQQAQVAAEALYKGDKAGNSMPVATEAQDSVIQEALSIRGAFSAPQGKLAKLATAFNGNYGMGATFKTIVASSELTAVSYSHWFSLGLKQLQRLSKGRENELLAAFKAVQGYRKELTAATELGEELPIDEFLRAWADAGNGTFDMDFFNLIDEGMETLLGSTSTFGAAKSYGVMADELNVALRQFGMADIQAGDIDDLSTFWHALKPENFPEKSPLEFMNLMNLAVQRANSRIEIATQFDFFIGKTAAQIREAGEAINDYVRIDEDTTIGKLLGETEKLVHKDDVEKLKFVQKYLDYDSTFSESALKRVVEVSDRITYVLKSSNTLIRPGHHVVSIVGEAAMNALAGVRVSSYNNTARILNKFRPGQYDNAGEPFKAYAELDARKGKRIKADEFNNVYWLRADGARETLPDEAVFKLAQKYGVLVHPGGGLEDFIVSGEPTAFLKGGYGKFHQGMNKLSVIASHRDNFFRLSHFVDELQRTKGAKNIEEAALAAATAIREWHPTSASLSAVEKKYMRRAVYFYTWQRIALTKIVATMIERPGIATIPSKIQYAFADANGFNPESFGDPWDPDGIYASWHTSSVFGPQFQGPRGAGDAYGIQPAIQPIDILAQAFEPFNVEPGENPLMAISRGANDTFANNANPIIKTLIESTSQSRLGEGGDLPSPPEYLINQVGFVNTISKMTGFLQDENPYETPQDREEKNNRLLLNLLLGQRITDYSTPSTQYMWTVDQRDIARRLAEGR
jgi:hypothetical protein